MAFFTQTLLWASPQATPEFNLVLTVIALRGTKLSDQQMMQKMTNILSRYTQVASSMPRAVEFALRHASCIPATALPSVYADWRSNLLEGAGQT